MRKRYIVSYDIRDPKRLNRTYKKMRGYGDHLQYSVFLCELSDKEKILMVSDISDIINLSEDSVIIFDLGSIESPAGKKINTIGKTTEIRERSAIII